MEACDDRLFRLLLNGIALAPLDIKKENREGSNSCAISPSSVEENNLFNGNRKLEPGRVRKLNTYKTNMKTRYDKREKKRSHVAEKRRKKVNKSAVKKRRKGNDRKAERK